MGNKRKKGLFLSEGSCQIHQPGGLKGGKWKGGDSVGERGAKQEVVCAYDTRWSEVTTHRHENSFTQGLRIKPSLGSVLTLPSSHQSFQLHLPTTALHSGTESHSCTVVGSSPERNVFKLLHALGTMTTYYLLNRKKIRCDKEVKLPKWPNMLAERIFLQNLGHYVNKA